MLNEEDVLLGTTDGTPVQEEEKTMQLRKPVVLGGVEYAELELREPTAGELSKASKAGGNVDIAIALIAIVAKVPVGAISRLCQRDFQEASDFLAGFTAGGQPTGAMSLPT